MISPRTASEPAQAVEALGRPVVVVPGSAVNFKITTKDDLELADAVLKARAARRGDDKPPPARPFDDEGQ